MHSVPRILLPILVLLTSSFALAGGAPLRVVLDPGHGGNDSGAIKDKIKESDIVLKVSLELAKLLRASDRFQVFLTRDRNKTVQLMERSKIAMRSKGDLFVSIHANSSPASQAHGVELYFQSQLAADEESMFLANRENALQSDVRPDQGSDADPSEKNMSQKGDVQAIVADLIRHTQIEQSAELAHSIRSSWRRSDPELKCEIRQGPFHVLLQTPMPAVLVEIGYITNPREVQRLTDTAYQKKLAGVLFEAIQNFSERLDKELPPSHITVHADRR